MRIYVLCTYVCIINYAYTYIDYLSLLVINSVLLFHLLKVLAMCVYHVTENWCLITLVYLVVHDQSTKVLSANN